MEIRELFEHEMPDALTLVWNVFLEFEAPDYGTIGATTFKNCIDDKAFIERLTFYGAFENKELVGVIATRNEGNHIGMLFVKKDQHKKGIGRKLFEYILPKSPDEKITVNSSPYAVNIYKKLGFEATATEQVTDGIRFTPMEYLKSK